MSRASRRPWDRAGAVFVGLVGFGVIASVVVIAQIGLDRVGVAAAFVAVIAVGELTRISLPGERHVTPVGTAAGLGYALLFNLGSGPVVQRPAQVVVVATVGFLAGAAVHGFAGRATHIVDIACKVAMISAVAFAFHALEPIQMRDLDVSDYRGLLGWAALLMVAIVFLGGIAESVAAAGIRVSLTHAPFRSMVRDEIKATGGIAAATGATGVLIALATPTMELYALPIFCVPLLLTQFAFRRYAGIRVTYLQMIRSLSRVTEIGGNVVNGHSGRVSRLSVAVGAEMGLSEPERLDLEYAALLHDIGQLSLQSPIPNGATLAVGPAERRRIAELGADVIRATGVLDRVAGVIERQADPYRQHSEPDGELPLESRIIKVASAYDDLVGPRGGTQDALAALERLRMGTSREYDPRVVEVLTHVIERHVERTRQIPA